MNQGQFARHAYINMYELILCPSLCRENKLRKE